MVLNYEINKKAIAEEHCENKDKPQLECNGHCYLSKQLKKAEEKENPIPNFNNLKELSPYVTLEIELLYVQNEIITSFVQASYQISFPIEACPGSVFQPPEA